MSEESYDAIIEGILFAMGEPVSAEQFAFALELDVKSAERILTSFMTRYNERAGGMRVIAVDDAYQMTSNPDIFEHLIRVAKQPKKFLLTQATLETLAIVAYRQPVTKLEIEKIRGVKSDYMVGRLMDYGFVEEVGRAETVGRPVLFATTTAFLRHFGLRNVDELRTRTVADTAEFEAAMDEAFAKDISEEAAVPTLDASDTLSEEDIVDERLTEPVYQEEDAPESTGPKKEEGATDS
ncbi:MAG: SMC-Scp complex subunit ScpB [Eubacteriales bacterium]|nr:SMC-Scp complex subunit ScpB [Eubacteriales bacterium]